MTPTQEETLLPLTVGEWYDRWRFFADSAGRNQEEQCQLCGRWIIQTIQSGNALARVSHLRAHIRRGELVERHGQYQRQGVPR